MELQLKNIGMIKEANVKLDGLTVIAGENDTGKSTLGKILFVLIQSIRWASNISPSDDNHYVTRFNSFKNRLFNNQITKSGTIKFNYQNIDFEYILSHHSCKTMTLSSSFTNNLPKIHSPLLIETPFVWSLSKMMTTKAFNANLLSEIDFQIPIIMEELFTALNTKLNTQNSISLNIEKIIKGEFKKEEIGDFYFQREETKYDLVNVAMGIKMFGLLQVLEANGHFYKGQVLILDEPEVHLHPEWQLKMAEVIVDLVKNGVKVVVNSHSPYMIDALKYYADTSKVDNNFYLAEKNNDDSSNISDVTMDISPIFEKLTKPLRKLHSMKLGLN